MFGSAKIKMSSNKEETHPSDFIERRKAHLERFLNRIGKHPSLRTDPDFRDFLEISDGLPKATNTSALSGANVMKFFKSVGEAVTKISVKMPQTEQVRKVLDIFYIFFFFFAFFFLLLTLCFCLRFEIRHFFLFYLFS